MTGPGTLQVTTPTEREIVIARSFAAPRQLVFEACTQSELLKRWMYGPSEWRLMVCEIDLRVGGRLRMEWHNPDGAKMGLSGVYREIVPPERIVHTELFDEDWTGGETLVTWELSEQHGKTTITMTVLYSSQEARDAALETPMTEGMAATYDRLEELLASMNSSAAGRELVIERIFDAPRELVWRAWTEPELLMRWWGPRIFSCPVARIDLRVGGKFLNCMQSDSGPEVWQKGLWSTGVYREIVPMERLVMTDCFADEEGNVVPASYYGMEGDFPLEMLITVTFEDAGDGKTKITLRHKGLPAGEHTEGATQGWNESFDKLAEALATSPSGGRS